MRKPECPSDTAEICATDRRRALVRASASLAGIDYVEVQPDGVTLCIHFFGALPKNLSERNIVIEGGGRIRGIKVVRARFHEHANGDLCLLLEVDKTGDFSTYCVCLVERQANEGEVKCSDEKPARVPNAVPQGIDARYACCSFSFRIDCPSTLDCKPEPCAPTPRLPPPPIDYLARDYESFRRLMLDRLAQTIPQWKERHAPDLSITVIELFGYVADQLSYQLDAVATEAFLRTARRRISVRRHARLVDYRMHEGSNARALVTIESDADVTLPFDDLAFASSSGDNSGRNGGLIDRREMADLPGVVIFEPVPLDTRTSIEIIAAHSLIDFYTWERAECCLPAGSTSATLYDSPGGTPKAPLRLRLKPGDILILEETRGSATGSFADADPSHRHAVRLTDAIPGSDPLTGARIWTIEWALADALPFDLQLSVRTTAPECAVKQTAVARGNVVLVDHGVTVDDENTWVVGVEPHSPCCLCDGTNTAQLVQPMPLSIALSQQPVTHAEPLSPDSFSALSLMQSDARAAVPAVWLDEVTAAGDGSAPQPLKKTCNFGWRAVVDLLVSGPADKCFVVEIDNEGIAHLRFGDGLHGAQPKAESRFRARLRVGNGPAGNVGRDSILWICRERGSLSGIRLRPRNPLAASGGTAPESIEHVKLYAPHAYSRKLERAVAAADYAQLAGDDPRVQGSFADLQWTGSWYEAYVSLDTFARYAVDGVLPQVAASLEQARRIGHDLRVVAARSVPLEIELDICVAPHHLRGDIEQAVRGVLSTRTLSDGSRGMFHPDELQFGADVPGSRIVAAVQAIDGVAHVELTRFARLYAREDEAKRSLEDNIIAVAPDEIAQLEGDPSFPERGRLGLQLKGGR